MSKKLDIAIENAHESVLDCIQNESVHDAEAAFMSYVLLVNFRNRFNLQEVEMAKSPAAMEAKSAMLRSEASP